MRIDPFGCPDCRATQPLGHVVEGIAFLVVQHPIGDAVPERVGTHVFGGSSRPSVVNGRVSAARVAPRTTFRTDSGVIRSD